MGKLICKDGTEVIISDETEQNLREKFGKKEREGFKKIFLCHLRIDVDNSRVKLGWDGNNYFCWESPDRIRNTIQGLQSAIDYIENS